MFGLFKKRASRVFAGYSGITIQIIHADLERLMGFPEIAKMADAYERESGSGDGGRADFLMTALNDEEIRQIAKTIGEHIDRMGSHYRRFRESI